MTGRDAEASTLMIGGSALWGHAARTRGGIAENAPRAPRGAATYPPRTPRYVHAWSDAVVGFLYVCSMYKSCISFVDDDCLRNAYGECRNAENLTYLKPMFPVFMF